MQYLTTAVHANSRGFIAAVIDGRYIYMVPNTYGQVTRYATTASFTSVGSYAVFNTTTVDADSSGFCCGVFDGRYLYGIPGLSGHTLAGKVITESTHP